jgi:hypothetical protein
VILAACCLSSDFEYYRFFPLLERMTLSDDQMSTWRSVIYFVDYRETSHFVTCNNVSEKLWRFWQIGESSDTF